MQSNTIVNKPLSCWTKEENELTTGINLFALAVNFGDEECVEQVVYEYDPMLESILELSAESINTGQCYLLHVLVTFNITSQFVVIVNDCNFKTSIIGHYNSRDEAVSVIQRKTCDIVAKCKLNPYERYTKYVIVDLAQTVPFFLKIGRLNKYPKLNQATPVAEFIHPSPFFTSDSEETLSTSEER